LVAAVGTCGRERAWERTAIVNISVMKIRGAVMAVFLAAIVLAVVMTSATPAEAQRGRGALGTVYVTSQGLYYDTFVSAEELPPHGRFQLLVSGETEYGPGDPGYLGGRWMVPNGSGGFDYLLCPLLPPGRTEP
jgi:hypothetical protein